MADQPNVFDAEPQTPAAPAPAPTPDPQAPAPAPAPDPFSDVLKNITNENGEPKYKSIEDALKALEHSQKYIPELKNQLSGTQEELQRVKQEMEKMGNLEDTVQKLLDDRQMYGDPDTTARQQGLKEEDIIKLVQQGLNQSKQEELMQANQKRVNDALMEKFGDKAMEVLDEKASKLNTTRQALGELAKQSPQLVLALFETGGAPQDPKPSMSSRRTPDPTPPSTYEKPKKSMLSGVSGREQAANLMAIRNQIYAKHGIDN